MRIAILDLTDLPPEISGGVKASQLIVAWLAPALPEAELKAVHVAVGAKVPDAGDFDGFVVSGSEKGVYDPTRWMAPLRQMLLAARARRVPLFGICFGHQVMADTFGGKAELGRAGEVVGARRYDVRGRAVDVHVWHRDQVTKIPPGAVVQGGADYCRIGVLAYDFPALSVQFHPEYTREFLDGAIRASQGRPLDGPTTKQGLISIAAGKVPADLMAAEAANLLRGA